MHIYLIGYRGSGKTTTARLLAQALDWSMVDTDDWIESSSGKTIRELFESMGENGFRDLEQTAIEQVSALDGPAVVALGGGAILRSANQEIIRNTGRRIWLQASPEKLHARIAGDSTSPDRRPSLTDQSGYDEVVKVLAERTPIYRSLAEFVIETDNQTTDEIVSQIANWLEDEG